MKRAEGRTPEEAPRRLCFPRVATLAREELSLFGVRFWGLSTLLALGAAALIGVPAVLIPTPLFHRMTPTSPLDYVIWGLSAGLLGPLLALAILFPSSRDVSASQRSGRLRALLGGFLSVGCLVCNQLVVLPARVLGER